MESFCLSLIACQKLINVVMLCGASTKQHTYTHGAQPLEMMLMIPAATLALKLEIAFFSICFIFFSGVFAKCNLMCCSRSECSFQMGTCSDMHVIMSVDLMRASWVGEAAWLGVG